ncbi:MAG: SDR family oxidoreductase, partial [Nitrososphaeria archaeon]|nr:SDR family oxidoreductase [Nitrososphaeria archaeon]
MSFKDKIVVITGASSGIGKATAIEFASKGSKLALVARRKEKLEELEKLLTKFNAEILICPCDVSDKAQVKQMTQKVLDKFGKIDILVNNAG